MKKIWYSWKHGGTLPVYEVQGAFNLKTKYGLEEKFETSLKEALKRKHEHVVELMKELEAIDAKSAERIKKIKEKMRKLQLHSASISIDSDDE